MKFDEGQATFPKDLLERALAAPGRYVGTLESYYQSKNMTKPGFAIELPMIEDIAVVFAELGTLVSELGFSVEYRVLARTMITEKMNYGIRMTWNGWTLTD